MIALFKNAGRETVGKVSSDDQAGDGLGRRRLGGTGLFSSVSSHLTVPTHDLDLRGGVVGGLHGDRPTALADLGLLFLPFPPKLTGWDTQHYGHLCPTWMNSTQTPV